MAGIKKSQVRNFIIDVDGVLTDGSYYYTAEGKVMKRFGPDDHDALVFLKKHLSILMVTGDKRGFAISQKRVVEDMKFPLEMASTFERVEWMEQKGLPLEQTIYMGDGIFDATVFEKVAYGIAPANAFAGTKRRADFVTERKGGEGAVAEACVHILSKFFGIGGIDVTEVEGGVWNETKRTD